MAYTLISNVTLSSAQSQVSFDNIPQTYKSLELSGTFIATGFNEFRPRINNDTNSNYIVSAFQLSGPTPTFIQNSFFDDGYNFWETTSFSLVFANYTANRFQHVIGDTYARNDIATPNGGDVEKKQWVGIKEVNQNISSIQLSLTNNLQAGSVFNLWGVS